MVWLWKVARCSGRGPGIAIRGVAEREEIMAGPTVLLRGETRNPQVLAGDTDYTSQPSYEAECGHVLSHG